MSNFSPEEIAILAARAADAKKANHIAIFDVRGVFDFTDYVLLASGRTDRQVRTTIDNIREKLRDEGEKPLRAEGESHGIWAVLDYGSLIIHILRLEEYEYYQLDRLWKDVPRVEWEPAATATD